MRPRTRDSCSPRAGSPTTSGSTQPGAPHRSRRCSRSRWRGRAQGSCSSSSQRSATFARDDLELANQVAGAATRRARPEPALRGRAHGALALAAARADGEPARDRARPGRRARGGRRPRRSSLLGVDAAALAALEGDELVITAAVGDGAEQALGARSAATGWVARRRRAVARAGRVRGRDHRTTGWPSPTPLLALGHRAYLGVPLAGPRGRAARRALGLREGAARCGGRTRSQALVALAANASVALVERRALPAGRASSASRASRSSRTSPTGSSPSIATATSCSGTAAAEEITGVPAAEAIGRTPLQVLQRDLESGARRHEPLVAIVRGDREVWLSLSEAVMRDPAGAVAGRIFAFRDISAEHVVEQMKSDFVSTVSRRAAHAADRRSTGSRRRCCARTSRSARRSGGRSSEYIAARVRAADVDRRRAAQRRAARHRRPEVELVPTDVGAVVNERRRPLPARRRTAIGSSPISARRAARLRRRIRRSCGRCSTSSSRTRSSTRPAAARSACRARAATGRGRGRRRRRGSRHPGAPSESGSSRSSTRRDWRTRAPASGLFIAQGLVREMGGTIWVDSEEGRGSRFAFELAGRRRMIRCEFRPGRDNGRGWQRRVLVIDDEAPIRLLCRVNLEAEGMEVLEAADGPSGLETARAERSRRDPARRDDARARRLAGRRGAARRRAHARRSRSSS